MDPSNRLHGSCSKLISVREAFAKERWGKFLVLLTNLQLRRQQKDLVEKVSFYCSSLKENGDPLNLKFEVIFPGVVNR